MYLDIMTLSQSDGVKKIAKLAFDNNLIPIWGSGFTKGCDAHSFMVPDGNRASELMKEVLVNERDDITLEELESFDFNKISKYFLDLVSVQSRDKFFKDYFTKVKIEGEKNELLQFDWPYAYTLNVDDGIENSSDFKPVLPYRNMKKPDTSIKLLYKLHGDAFAETTYTLEKNIVFSAEQYVTSLTDDSNGEMLNNLIADYAGSNLLFIGCSLINEPDLSYVFNKVKNGSKNNLRILLRTKVPETTIEIAHLMSYGVNEIILIDNYDLFYVELIKEIKRLKTEEKAQSFKYKNPIIAPQITKDDTCKYLSGSRIFDEEKNTFYIGGMHIQRKVVEEIENQLSQYNCVIIKGRRFSGKTFALATLCSRNPKYTVYFFPSTSLFDEQLVYTLISKSEDSLFIFDSNSVSSGVHRIIANSNPLLHDNRNKILLASNSNDNLILDSLSSGFVEISSFFVDEELTLNKLAADKYGLVKRLPKKTNIDYLYFLSKEQKISIPLLEQFPTQLSFEERVLFIMLATSDKVFLGDALALDISFDTVNTILHKYSGIIEEIPTEKNERTTHSTSKIVHNSKMFVISLVNSLSYEEIQECIVHIVKKTNNDRQRHRLYIETILFDTINQLFGGRNGAGHFIFDIYSSLQVYLNGDLHYWLQRAKSIYRILPNDKEQLEIAYGYTKKVYLEGWNKISTQASLSISLISCLMYEIEKNADVKECNQQEAIIYAHNAIFSDYYKFNTRYLKNELQINNRRRNYLEKLKKLCIDYLAQKKDDNVSFKAQDIANRLNEIQLI